jgi:tetratricopeptide (TPR) repeat protein
MFDALEGRLDRSQSAVEAILASRDDLSPRDQIGLALTPAYDRLYSVGDRAGAVQSAEDVLRRFPLDSFEPADRQTLSFAEFFARAGESERARALVEKWEADRIAGDPAPDGSVLPLAFADLADGRIDEALARLERLDGPAPDRCDECIQISLALAYDQSGDRDAAIERYERYLAARDPFKIFTDYFARPYTLRRLGELYDARGRAGGPDASGDLRRAAEHYGSFVELWADADPVLQPAVESAQNRLEAILQEIG